MSDHKALLKHSFNYLLANIATKALAFVAIPVYTRLLTVEEYGIVNVFLSLTGISTVLMTLNTEVAINRYFFDAKDENDFKCFVGTTLRLNAIVCVLSIFILMLCLGLISESVGITKLLVLSLIPVSIFNVSNNIFQQIYNPQLKSRKIALVTSFQTYLAFGLSVIFISILKSERYYGYVLGMIAAMLLTGSYMWSQISKFHYGCFKKEYLKYILSYSLPFVPYSLSNAILSGFSRIFIGGESGFALAGAYSLATNIAVLVDMIIMVTHSSWNPYYFRYMNAKDYKSVDQDYNIIWRVTLIAAIALSLFGTEIGLILSKDDFLGALYVLPMLALGYSFHQWAYVYIRNTSYAKKTIWNAVCVLLSGMVNVILNVLLIPPYGCTGAAVAIMVSYILLAFWGYLANHFFIKCYTTPAKIFFIPLMISIPFFLYSITFYDDNPSFEISAFLLKALIWILFVVIMLYQYKDKFLELSAVIINKLHNK